VIKLRDDNKGIATADLLFATLIFLIIAVGFVNMISSEMTKTNTSELGKARMLGERIAETINTVYINGNGYAINITLPTDYAFTARVDNTTRTLIITYNGKTTNMTLIPTSISNVNMTTGQRYIIKNQNGTITFTLY